MSEVIALIPARAGSKGVLNKNIKMLGGHALIEWSIAACKKSKSIDRVIVSTDSVEYGKLCQSYGAEVPFHRPERISGDCSTDYEFVIHALDWLAINGGEPDFIVHIRPTTPFRSPHLIDDAIVSFQASAQATALRSVHEMSESAYKTFEVSADGQLKRVGDVSTALDAANNARQQFPSTYFANGYVDVLSTVFIRKQGLLHGNKVMPYITPSVAEVDTEDDFAYLEFQLSRSPLLAQQIFN
ncbi:acylneuraminate cytidylyltransferase family protein [Candidatus Njordibacter sp. Uisw_039]|uniref:acylneuraminate cytidylyltransferase family protein n=1 Tax=Candidatus Njordibacter sp. Uisw_039 TaxID=3230972 RepID=UPI003D37DF70